MKTESKKSGKTSKKTRKVSVFSKKKKPLSKDDDIETLKVQHEQINEDEIKSFSDLPLSKPTQKGLKSWGYIKPTEIQLKTVGLSLQGKDILGAAQTGSGKTLAFLIPILELLYCKKWTHLDGLGALVITPTRELAYQIFEMLRKVGQYHDFSAGLVIGGKDLKFERKRLDQCNIIICTPGRLLHHMDENPLFNCVNLQILVLDEADRCLDLGFERTMNAIIENLPPKRQTLLFSATQTKSVKDLARLSLKDPSYISVYKNSEFSTPDKLNQSYTICELHNKISVLWSFIKNHLKQKCIIFLASCKEVKYVYEIFCKLRPGTSLLALYGGLHQLRRMDIYKSFCEKTCAVLFATDLAARGLDFPKVNWVVQYDCPEDTATYIHRVGRTARYYKGGDSLLMLLPSEEKFVTDLVNLKIHIEEVDIDSKRLQNPVKKMEAFLAKDPTLKDTAKRAFMSYIKSVFLMKNKKIFNVNSLGSLDLYAKSLGLAITPRVRFLQRMNSNKPNKNEKHVNNRKNLSDLKSEEKTESTNNNKHSFFNDDNDSDDNEDNDDEIFKVKRVNHDIELPSKNELEEMEMHRTKKRKCVTKIALAKKILKKQIVPNKKIIFNEEGDAVISGQREKHSKLAQEYEQETEGGIDIEKAKLILKEEDKFDKVLFRSKVKAKHREEKLKKKEKQEKEQAEQDDFGTDSEEEPDVSWLPDPDKIYADKSNIGSGSEESEREDSKTQTITTKTKSKKRKLKSGKSDGSVRKKLPKVDTSLNVNESEQLALLLLQNKN